MWIKDHNKREALRITLIIVLCMVTGKALGLSFAVYLALYPAVATSKLRDYSLKGFAKFFIPCMVTATAAMLVTEIFADHPFIIWTISLLLFDFMRRRADTPAKLGGLLLPMFSWILIVIFSKYGVDIPDMLREMLFSMLVTIIAVKAVHYLLPLEKGSKPPPPMNNHIIHFKHRFASIFIIGLGLAFLMIVDLRSASFCMVPVISVATQFTREDYAKTIKARMLTQVGGCAVGAIFSLFLAGHQGTVLVYILALSLLIYTVASMIASASDESERSLHADALLGALVPIQLYIGTANVGVESTFLRAWELAITFFILFVLLHLTHSPKKRSVCPNP